MMNNLDRFRKAESLSGWWSWLERHVPDIAARFVLAMGAIVKARECAWREDDGLRLPDLPEGLLDRKLIEEWIGATPDEEPERWNHPIAYLATWWWASELLIVKLQDRQVPPDVNLFYCHQFHPDLPVADRQRWYDTAADYLDLVTNRERHGNVIPF